MNFGTGSLQTIGCNYKSVADPGFARGERTMVSARSASLNGGLRAEPPAGSRGRAPGGGQGAKPP